jgi:CBS domain containing-hemolysin-like protein
LAATSLEVFQIFGEKEAIAFQAQISADLNYFKPGYVLLDTAIASIRGLVEIDQAERDRILQDQNQKLQDQIQALGVGIAAGAIVASSSGLILAEKITFPWEQNHGKDLHPFTIAVLLSLGGAIVFWLLVFCGLKLRRNPAKKNK